jgi:uncharacterized Fe-S cluster-containing radical SAM superfamily enzyme
MVSVKLHKSGENCQLLIGEAIEVTGDCKFLQKTLERIQSHENTQELNRLLRNLSGKLKHHWTQRPLWFVDEPLPLIGYNAFGIIDRGTNVLQVRPITGCNLSCIFCSVDEGPRSRTRINDFVVSLEHLVEWFAKVASVKQHPVEAHIDGQGEPTLYPWFLDLVQALAEHHKTKIVSFQTNGTFLNEQILEELADMPKKVRINLSLHTLDFRKAIMLSGAYLDLKRLLEVVRYAAELKAQGKLDIVLTPVYLPGLNDRDLEDLVLWAQRLKIPVLIQKFERHRLGRVPKLRRYQTWEEFYDWLRMLEKKLGVKLIYRLGDSLFEFHRDRRYPINLHTRSAIAEVVLPGRTSQEYIGWIKEANALIMIHSKYRLQIGDRVRLDKIHVNDSILYAYY